jgi:hypothetical protein
MLVLQLENMVFCSYEHLSFSCIYEKIKNCYIKVKRMPEMQAHIINHSVIFYILLGG